MALGASPLPPPSSASPVFSSLGLLHNRCSCNASQRQQHHEAATETESETDGAREERGREGREGESSDGFYYCAHTRTTRARTHSHTGQINRGKVSSQNLSSEIRRQTSRKASRRTEGRRLAEPERIAERKNGTAELAPPSASHSRMINKRSISLTFIDPQRGSSPRSCPPESLLLPRIRPPAGL